MMFLFLYINIYHHVLTEFRNKSGHLPYAVCAMNAHRTIAI